MLFRPVAGVLVRLTTLYCFFWYRNIVFPNLTTITIRTIPPFLPRRKPSTLLSLHRYSLVQDILTSWSQEEDDLVIITSDGHPIKGASSRL